MSLDINCCRLCLQKIKGPAETLSKDSKTSTLVTSLFPGLDTSLVINSKMCIGCFKYAQLSNLMTETVTKNEQKILLELQNTQLFEKNTCRLCLNTENLEDFDVCRKPVICNSCWQIVKSIYLFKKKCFAIERILKCYCAANGINSLNRKELEKVSLSYQEKMFSENADEDDFLLDINARSIANSNLTQNNVDPQNMYINNLTEDKDNVFEEYPYTANKPNVKNGLLKEEDEIEIKEEKLCEFIESNENDGMAGDAMNLDSIGRIHQTEITSNASEIIKTENIENICHLIQKSPSQPVIDTEEMIHGSNDDILKKRNLQSHMRNHSSEHCTHLSLKCEECPYETIVEVNMELHMKAHQSQKNILKCSKCYYITMCSNSLKNHMETHKSKPKTFQCQKCDYVTRKHAYLASHMLSHQENYNFKCQKCSYQAKTKALLISHILIHQDSFNFKCQECSYQAKRKHNLVKHMLIHQENYNFQCHKCSYQAKRKQHLMSHLLIHQDNCNFKCQKCRYKSKFKTNLTRHMLIHQNNCNFQCHNCDYQAKRKGNLIKHMLIHQENYNFNVRNVAIRPKERPASPVI